MKNGNFIPILSTYIFNLLQLGLIFFVVKNHIPLVYAFYLYLVFELAILFDCTIKFGSQYFWSIVLLISSVLFFCFFDSSFPSKSISIKAICYSVLFFQVFALKKIRSINNAVGKVKKIWRALGYLTCFLFDTDTLVIGAGIILINVLFLKSSLSEKKQIILPSFNKNYVIAYSAICFHHFHYFSYAYIIPIIVFNNSGIAFCLFGAIFYIGWVGYYIFENITKSKFFAVAIGHTISSIAVLLMISTHNIYVILSLWLITAIGAGTIVLLRGIYTKKDVSTYDQFKTWESFGHLLGIAAMGIAFKFNNLNIGFIIGGFSGFLCVVFTLILLLDKNSKRVN